MLKFTEKDHKYSSEDNTDWVSVTSVVKKFCPPFDGPSMAAKCAKNKKSKWYGMTAEEILAAWTDTSSTAIDLGHKYHAEREKLVCDAGTIERDGVECKVVKPIIKGSEKFSPNQQLENNTIYPEHMVYLKSAQICGQSDLVEVRNSCVNIIDYKTNKTMTIEGHADWRGVTKKLMAPLQHMEDSKLSIYNLQLSLYMYIILKHNPQLQPGDLYIYHIIFKELDQDRLGGRMIATDENNDPIVEKIVKYRLPYLKTEVKMVIDYLAKEKEEALKAKSEQEEVARQMPPITETTHNNWTPEERLLNLLLDHPNSSTQD